MPLMPFDCVNLEPADSAKFEGRGGGGRWRRETFGFREQGMLSGALSVRSLAVIRTNMRFCDGNMGAGRRVDKGVGEVLGSRGVGDGVPLRESVTAPKH